MIAVFGYVREVLYVTNITLIPRRQPDIYLILVNQWTINEFEQIIKDMRDEK
jgi:hypothetical protein